MLTMIVTGTETQSIQPRRLIDETMLQFIYPAARGPQVDTAALVAALHSGHVRAALDVTDPEPLPPGHPLWKVITVQGTAQGVGCPSSSVHRGCSLMDLYMERHTLC